MVATPLTCSWVANYSVSEACRLRASTPIPSPLTPHPTPAALSVPVTANDWLPPSERRLGGNVGASKGERPLAARVHAPVAVGAFEAVALLSITACAPDDTSPTPERRPASR